MPQDVVHPCLGAPGTSWALDRGKAFLTGTTIPVMQNHQSGWRRKKGSAKVCLASHSMVCFHKPLSWLLFCGSGQRVVAAGRGWWGQKIKSSETLPPHYTTHGNPRHMRSAPQLPPTGFNQTGWWRQLACLHGCQCQPHRLLRQNQNHTGHNGKKEVKPEENHEKPCKIREKHHKMFIVI